jgi:hypothetical protein
MQQIVARSAAKENRVADNSWLNVVGIPARSFNVSLLKLHVAHLLM